MTKTPENNYRIERLFFDENKKKKIIKTGLTLQQAQEHCQRDDTHAKPDKNGIRAWFDSYTNH